MNCFDPATLNSPNISLPLLILGGLFLLALITYIFRSWEWLTTSVAAVITGWLALWLWNLDLSAAPIQLSLLNRVIAPTGCLERLGFMLQVHPAAIPVLATSMALACIAFVLTIRISQGHSFVPFTLILLAGYALLAMLVSGPVAAPLITPLLLVGLSSIGIYILQAGRATRSDGPLRSLIPAVLTFPLFLIASWYADRLALSPRDPELMNIVSLLLTVGIIVLLAPVPLHSAMADVAETAPPIVTMLLTLLYQLALLHLIYRVLTAYPFIPRTIPLEFGLTIAGVLTAAWGGIAAAGAEHPGRLWGYAALHDWGLLIMLLGIPGNTNWQIVLFLFALRAISMLTAAIGLSAIEHASRTFDSEWLQGIGKRMPWNSAAFLIGGLGLAGFPLSAGFTGHWVGLMTVASNDWRIAAVVMVASAGVVIGFIRMARTLYGPLIQTRLLNENPVGALLAFVGILISASLALSPQLLTGPIESALLALSR